ncbi:hypothetical protein C5167_019670 [Papaver somniferum]|uniref:Uncharacterized protein n=1 Tax=Papaver somniferum TaxID=3469 RepID=A0A4Y7ISY3_PAPSO|nr:hypothetical protein C5167_019670 [Papaver somniferum]
MNSQQQNPPDYPSESFCLSKEEELDWVDRNAFYERKDSTKGKSNSAHHNHSSSTTSQRFSLKSSIIGLPKAPQNTCKFRHTSNGKTPTNVRFFPKRSRSKSSVQDAEPSSPKVSCIGRVRSRRQRLRQLSRQRSATVTTTTTVKPSKTKFWMSFKSVLCLRCRDNRAVNIADGGSTETASTPSQKSEKRKSSSVTDTTSVAEPHGMNDLKRFASGRRYDSLGVNDV